MTKTIFSLDEILVINLIAFTFITIISLAQFGVHITVDTDVDLIPVEINSGRELYVQLTYENNAEKKFWMPASVVFGKTGKDDINGLIQAGDSIKRNVFLNTRSDQVVGVTKHGTSILSLYYYNGRLFRYGIWIMLIVDIFIGFLAIRNHAKHKNTVDISQFRYDPEDKKELELNKIIFRIRDFRLLYVFSIPFWIIWAVFAADILSLYGSSDTTINGWLVRIIIIFALFIILSGTIIFIKYRAKNKDQINRIIENANTYLSDVGDDFPERLQKDLYKGLPFLKKYNLIISERYIIGSMKSAFFDPVAIPKEQISEITYRDYELITIKYHIHEQEVFFHLKNGKEICMTVGDRGNLGLTLKALVDCGVPIRDVTQEKSSRHYSP